MISYVNKAGVVRQHKHLACMVSSLLVDYGPCSIPTILIEYLLDIVFARKSLGKGIDEYCRNSNEVGT